MSKTFPHSAFGSSFFGIAFNFYFIYIYSTAVVAGAAQAAASAATLYKQFCLPSAALYL